jgi:hypothetical protein
MLGSLRKHALGGEPAPDRARPQFREAKAQIELVKWLRSRDDCLVMQLENARKRNMRQVARDKAAGLLGGAPL